MLRPYLYTADGTLFGSITNDQLEANTNMIAPYLAGVLAGREVSAVVMMGGSRAGVVVGEPITGKRRRDNGCGVPGKANGRA